LDFIVLPGKLYRSKEPVIAALITKRVIGAAGPYIAKTSKMALAQIKVTAPAGDWRRIPRRFKRIRGSPATTSTALPRLRSSTAPPTTAPARRRATDSAARHRAAATNPIPNPRRE
jgi:hypothetical protein